MAQLIIWNGFVATSLHFERRKKYLMTLLTDRAIMPRIR